MGKRFKIEKIEKCNEDIKDRNLKVSFLAVLETILAIATISIVSDITTSNYVGTDKILPFLALAEACGADVLGVVGLAEVISNKTVLKFKRDYLLDELQKIESQQSSESKSR